MRVNVLHVLNPFVWQFIVSLARIKSRLMFYAESRKNTIMLAIRSLVITVHFFRNMQLQIIIRVWYVCDI